MIEEYLKAFVEVEQIIRLMPKKLQDKIPEEFKKMLSVWKDPNYVVIIEEPFEKCNIMQETKTILSVIYHDFLCDDEIVDLNSEENPKIKEYKEFIKQNNLSEVSKNNIKEHKNSIKEEITMTEYKKENFLQKIFNKIKQIFNKKIK